jgi:hypothetical protein
MGTHLTVPPPPADPPASLQGRQVTDGEPVNGVELLQFAQTLCASSNYAQLERRFVAGFGRLFGLPMYAFVPVLSGRDSPGRTSCNCSSSGSTDTATTQMARSDSIGVRRSPSTRNSGAGLGKSRSGSATMLQTVTVVRSRPAPTTPIAPSHCAPP